MGSLIPHVVMALKRLVRPLIPDALVARFRTPARPGWARTNVDLFTDSDSEAWARATPDTWRIMAVPPTSTGREAGRPAASRGAGQSDKPMTERMIGTATDVELDLLDQILRSGDYAAAILARTDPPPVNRGSFTAPIVEPLALVTHESPPDSDPVAAFHQLLNEGRPLALVPAGPAQSTSMPLTTKPIHEQLSLVVMAGVPLHDVGGGFRGAQLARELARRGAHVTYVHEYDSGESVDLGLRIIHPRLEEVRSDWFDPKRFVKRAEGADRIVLVEFPHKDIVEAAIAMRDMGGYRVVYDVIDDWSDRALGGMWWAAEYEDSLFAAADAVVASAPSLIRRAEKMSDRNRPLLIPNGFNDAVFPEGTTFATPADLPQGTGPVFTYHGSLYGDWIDWRAIGTVATTWPQARLLMIGDERSHPPMPQNVSFVGLKPQAELAGYLAVADVSVIPFKVNDTTHAVSPLKAFEAMAMGVPVAAPPLETLIGLQGVHTNTDLVEAVRAALAAPRPDPGSARADHSWKARVDDLLAGLRITLEPGDGQEPEVQLRPPRAYSKLERRVGFG